jgi:hypothetical protein
MGNSRHRSTRALTRTLATGALALGIATFVFAILHFAYYARLQAVCSGTTSDILTSARWITPDPADCVNSDLEIEADFRIDSIVAIVGLILLSGGALRLWHARRRTKRLVLMLGSSVLLLVSVYAFFLNSMLR